MTTSDVPIDEQLATRVELAAEKFGEKPLVDRLVSLLTGHNEGEELLLYVGGRHAQGILDGAPPLYWPELWGARALLHVWDDSAASAVLAGVANQAWRVREMCLKVCAVRKIGDVKTFSKVLTDENPRVRAAAARAVTGTGDAESVGLLEPLLGDPDKEVKHAAREGLKTLQPRRG